MKVYRYPFKHILFAILMIFIASCAVNPVTGQKELMLMSEQMEIDWGNSVYPNALWGEVGGGGQYHDPELEQYLGQIVKRLNGVSHRPNLPVDFAIQNSSVPNAWAIPGHVAMTRGLVSNLDNEAQFAFVMGHEMGHVAARHSAAQMSRNILAQVGLIGLGIALDNKKNSEWILGVSAMQRRKTQEHVAKWLVVAHRAITSVVTHQLLRCVGAHPKRLLVELHTLIRRAAEDHPAKMGKMSNIVICIV